MQESSSRGFQQVQLDLELEARTTRPRLVSPPAKLPATHTLLSQSFPQPLCSTSSETTMDPDHAAKFAIHEACREGKSMPCPEYHVCAYSNNCKQRRLSSPFSM